MSAARWARRLVAWSARLVPHDERPRFREEWLAELRSLEGVEAAGPTRLPSPLAFARGAVVHALWLRLEGWRSGGLGDDLRLAVRSLRRAPAFAVVAVTTLALGIGAAGTLATLVYTLTARPLPGVEADGLVQIGRLTDDGLPWGSFSWRSAQLVMEDPGPAFEQVAGFSLHQFRVGDGPGSEAAFGHFVTGNWFQVLGTRPALGRLLGPSDDVVIGGHPVVVLAHGFWERRWGGTPDVVGRTVPIDGVPYEVVGVAPAGYVGVHHTGFAPDLFVPAVMNPGYGGDLPFDSWRWSWLSLVGRTRGGGDSGSLASAEAALTERHRRAAEVNEGARIVLEPGVGVDPWSRASIDRLSRMLSVFVGLVLLLTAASVANLALARATGRDGEFSVRSALGAGRGRLGRELLLESGMLSVVAAVLAVPLVFLLIGGVPAVVPVDLLTSLRPDARVWAMVGGMALVAAVINGAGPAWFAMRATRGAARRGRDERRGPGRIRSLLVVVQLGVSLGLVAGVGLLVRSVSEGAAADPGFESRDLRAVFLRLSFDDWDAEPSVPLVQDAVRRLEELPGVRSAAVGTQVPVAGGQSMGSVAPAGRPDDELQVEFTAVGPGYFETLGIGVREGRVPGDFGTESEPVMVVSRELADRFWPGESPVGRRMEGTPGWRVIGVADDVQLRTLRARPNPGVYVPFEQAWQPGLAFAVSTTGDGGPGPAALEEAVEAAAPGLEARAVDVRSALLGTLDDTRRIGGVVAGFAALALLLASVGLFGVVSMVAQRRTREFGIRIALGARPDAVVALTLRRAWGLALAGISLGLLVAWGVGRSLDSVLYRVSPLDPLALAVAGVVLAATATAASWWPARRAGRVDPVSCLRE